MDLLKNKIISVIALQKGYGRRSAGIYGGGGFTTPIYSSDNLAVAFCIKVIRVFP